MRIRVVGEEFEDCRVAIIRDCSEELVEEAKKRGCKVIAPCGNADLILEKDEVEELAEIVESYELFREVVRRSPDPIVVHDGEKIIFVSDSLSRITGLSAENFLGEKVTKFVHPKFLPLAVERMRRMFCGEEVEPAEEVFVLPDGRECYVEVNSALISYKGKPAILLIIRDLTERKKVEDRLKRIESFFRNAKDVFFILDREGRFVEVNPAVERVLGMKLEELVGKNLKDLVHPEDYEKFGEFFRRVLERGDGVGVFRFLKDGEVDWVELHEWVMSDYVEGIARVVTDRVKLETELKESERKYREFFENSLDVIVVSDLKGNILEVNRAFEDVTGYSRTEVVGRHFSEFLPEDQVGEIYRKYNEAFRLRKDLKGVILKFVNKRGETVIAEGNVRLLWRNGKIVGFIANFRDVTERLRLEDKLKKTNELLRKLLAVSEAILKAESVEGLKREVEKLLSDYGAKISEEESPFRIEWSGRFYGYLHVTKELEEEEERLIRAMAENLAFAFSSLEERRAREEMLKKLIASTEHIAELVDKIRNPLAAIYGYAELLDDEELRKKIGRQVRRIEELVDTIELDWEEMENITGS
ncbi:MAG: PAS domain S-box protein [Archaeoglobaceae archaeon]